MTPDLSYGWGGKGERKTAKVLEGMSKKEKKTPSHSTKPHCRPLRERSGRPLEFHDIMLSPTLGTARLPPGIPQSHHTDVAKVQKPYPRILTKSRRRPLLRKVRSSPRIPQGHVITGVAKGLLVRLTLLALSLQLPQPSPASGFPISGLSRPNVARIRHEVRKQEKRDTGGAPSSPHRKQ